MFLLTSKYEKLVKLLKLDKPLVIFDVTTTGTSISSDKIIHLAFIKIWPDGRVKKEEMMIDPEFKMPAESIAIHGIRNRDLKEKPNFRELAQRIWEEFNDCYYGGFNIENFDLPILRREFLRVGMDLDYDEDRIIDSKAIFHHMAPRTISFAYKYYVGKEIREDYDAANHAELVTEVLIKQLEKYKEARNLDFLKMIRESYEDIRSGTTRKFYWVNGEAYFAFSKYKNLSVSSVVKKDRKFLEWILESDFRDDTKSIIRQALEPKS
jgi:DNA polymerase-3 subunit epsilon